MDRLTEVPSTAPLRRAAVSSFAPEPGPQPIHALHAQVGNAAIGRMLHDRVRIAPPGDPLEHEADRTAEQVTQPVNIRSTGSPILQRKCAGCEGEEEPEIHRKADSSAVPRRETSRFRIAPPSDPLEHEADRIAEHVTQPVNIRSAGSPILQRKCAECEAEEEPEIHRKADSSTPARSTAPGPVVSGAGSPLEPRARAEFEGRFGSDFGHVRVHTGTDADASARYFGALAYAYGPNIVFRAGSYSPDSTDGKRLLAHELAHVMQQRGGVIMRKASDEDLKKFDENAAKIKALDAYTKLGKADRDVADAILTEARDRDNALYYSEKLLLLFNTPFAKAPTASKADKAAAIKKMTEENRASIKESKDEEIELAKNPKYVSGEEEKAAKDTTRPWTERLGKDDVKYFVDISDYANIVVRMKVHLVPKGGTTKDDIKDMQSFEQGIERISAKVGGYILDVEFVNSKGKAGDVFEVPVDVTDWPTSANVVGGAQVLAHEFHHLLRLPDRYDYIESHADNDQMEVSYRLSLFRRQLARGQDPIRDKSLMDQGEMLTDEDVCLAADPSNAETCLAERKKTQLTTLRQRAWGKAFRTRERLLGIRPEPLAHTKYDIPRNPEDQRQAMRIASTVFGKDVSLDDLTNTVDAILTKLQPGLQFKMTLSTPPAAVKEKWGLTAGDMRCQRTPMWVETSRPAVVRICSHALMDSAGCQTDRLLRDAAEMAGVGTAAPDQTACPKYDCTAVAGGVKSADAWACFIHCYVDYLGAP